MHPHPTSRGRARSTPVTSLPAGRAEEVRQAIDPPRPLPHRRHRVVIPTLSNESPLSFRPTIARAVGAAGAALLERIWALLHSPRSRRRQLAGETFVYYPLAMMAADVPWLRQRTLRRVISRLQAKGLLTRARSRDGGRGTKTSWFGVNKGAVDALYSLFPAPTVPTPAATPTHGRTERRRDAE